MPNSTANRLPRTMPGPIRGIDRRAAILACALAGACSLARADIQLCNESTTLVFTTAVGYFDSKAQRWATLGWYSTRPGTCKTAAIGAITRGVVYIYADYGIPTRPVDDVMSGLVALAIAAESQGAIGGDTALCVRPEPFAIVGETRCVSRGYERRGFAEIPTGGAPHILLELLDGGRVSVSARP